MQFRQATLQIRSSLATTPAPNQPAVASQTSSTPQLPSNSSPTSRKASATLSSSEFAKMLRKLLLRDNSRTALDSVFQSLASSASKWQTSFHAMLSKRRIQTNKLLTSWPQAKTL